MTRILLIILVLFPALVFSQTNFSGNQTTFNENQPFEKASLANDIVNIEDDIQHLRYCIGKYRKEKVTGIYLTLGGAFTAGLASGFYLYDVIDETTASIVYLGGGVAVISGYVMQLTCNRWLKKAALSPADSGIGVKLSF